MMSKPPLSAYYTIQHEKSSAAEYAEMEVLYYV